jgi:hypothetical protein
MCVDIFNSGNAGVAILWPYVFAGRGKPVRCKSVSESGNTGKEVFLRNFK